MFNQALRVSTSRSKALIHVSLFLITFVTSLSLYSLTAAPSTYWGDTSELQRVAFTLANPHPTGYPLYILLGHTWLALFPFGTVAWKMTILSAVFAAGTVSLISSMVFALTGRALAALFAACLLTISASFWSQAIVAEVYSLHTFFVAILMIILLQFQRQRSNWLLVVASLMLGIGLAHHRMFILLVPGVFFFVLFIQLADWRRTLSISMVIQVILAFALGWLPYLLTYMQGDWRSTQAFWGYIFESGNRWFSAGDLFGYFEGTVWPLLKQQMGGLGPLLGLVGLLYCWRTSTRDAKGLPVLLGVSWFLAIAFLTVYRVPDIFAFVPHFQVINVVLISLGLEAILSQFRRFGSQSQVEFFGTTAIFLILFGIVFVQGKDTFRVSDRSRDWYIHDRSEAIMSNMQSNAILFADWASGQSIRYLQDVEFIREDVSVVIDDMKAETTVQSYISEDRPLYLLGTGWLDNTALVGHELVSAEPSVYQQELFRLLDPSAFQGQPTLKETLHQLVLENLVLERYTITPWPLVVDEMAQLQLCWLGQKALLNQRLLTLHIDSENNWLNWTFRLGASLDSSNCSKHYFLVPPAPFNDPADVQIQIFEDGASAPEQVLTLQPFPISVWSDKVVPERFFPIQLPQADIASEDAKLIGITTDGVTSPGISFPIRALWKIAKTASFPREIDLHLQDPSGVVVDRKRIPLLPDALLNQLSTNQQPQPSPAYVSSKYWFTVPRTAHPGSYSIWLTQNETVEPVNIGSIEVEDFPHLWKKPTVSNSVAFDFAEGHIRLVGYQLETSEETVNLVLVWKSIELVDRNWKVFVHLVDQNGTLRAQSDGFPGDGLRWTDSWKPEEYIVDNRVIPVTNELQGRYVNIMVGLYDPETGERVLIRADQTTSATIDAVQLTEIAIPRAFGQ